MRNASLPSKWSILNWVVETNPSILTVFVIEHDLCSARCERSEEGCVTAEKLKLRSAY